MRRALYGMVLVGLSGLSGCGHSPALLSTLSIETVGQQTIKGWGIFPCTIQNDRPHAADYTLWQRPNAARLIWKELGISFWRGEILPGSYDAAKNDGSLDTRYLDASLVRQIRLANSFGRRPYILSVWSPPAPFKDPAVTFGTDPKSKRPAHLRLDREEAYCRYIVRVFDHLTKERQLAAPLAFSIQNEPNYASDQWNGTPYDAVQWQRVTKKMRRALDAGGYKGVQLIGPEGGSYADSIAFIGGPDASALTRDPELAAALEGFAFHSYSANSKLAPYPEQLFQVTQRVREKKKDIWMSEYSITGKTRTPLAHTLETAQRLARETAFIPCNYWAWWQGYYPAHPKNEVLLTGKDDQALHISKTYYVLQKLWRSAPAGSVVHRIKSSDEEIKGFAPESVQTVAFVKGAQTTVLIINPTTSAKTVALNGLTGTTATAYLTDAQRDMEKQESQSVVKGMVEIRLQPRSIVVLVAR